MNAIRELCGQYARDEIYNMSETGLFWRRGPSTGLLAESGPGVKTDLSHITVVACTNCTGSDRLPVWIIGKTKQPTSLRGFNIKAMGGDYKSNGRAWMNSILMREWLLSFYSHVGNRNVLLLLDNFKPHVKGVELAPPPSNVRIKWLPAQSTSLYQPLEQGVFQTFKFHYQYTGCAFSFGNMRVTLTL